MAVGLVQAGRRELVELGGEPARPRGCGPQCQPDQRPLGVQAGQLHPAAEVGVVRGRQHAQQQLLVEPAQPPLPAAVVEQVHRQGRGGPLGDGHQSPARLGRGTDHQPAPATVVTADPGHQPAVAAVPDGALVGVHPVGPALPVLEELGDVTRAGPVVQDPVLLVLQHHRRGREATRGGEDLRRAGLGHAELGEGVVDPLGLAQGSELLVDEALPDDLREGREAHLAPQGDQRQPEVLAGRDHRGGDPLPAASELHEQAHRVGLGEAAHESREGLGVLRQRDARREQQVAAAQQRTDVGELGGVHPAHGAVQPPVSGQHLRVGAPDHGHLQHAGHRQHGAAATVSGPRGFT